VGFQVRKYNSVTCNYDDLLQHVWQRLIADDVVGGYRAAPGVTFAVYLRGRVHEIALSWRAGVSAAR